MIGAPGGGITNNPSTGWSFGNVPRRGCFTMACATSIGEKKAVVVAFGSFPVIISSWLDGKRPLHTKNLVKIPATLMIGRVSPAAS